MSQSGQVILDPLQSSKSEKYLFKNKMTLKILKQGIQQAENNELHDLGRFAVYLDTENIIQT